MQKYNLIDSCYFCTTPMQIISALNLALELNEISDLYIIGQFKTYKKVAKNIESKNIFRRVITVDEGIFSSIRNKRSFIYKAYNISKWYIQSEKIANKILVEKTRYKKMYFSSQTLVSRIIRLHFMKEYSDMKFFQFDEGIGSYYLSPVYRIKIFDKVLRILIFGKRATEKEVTKLLYIPEASQWYAEVNGNNEKIDTMPKWGESSNKIELLNDIFEFNKEDTFSEKLIIFDTLREDMYGTKGANALSYLYNEFIDYFGSENVLHKRHPRDKIRFNIEIKEFRNNNMPAEVVFQNIDLEEKVLLSTNSTSCVTPKLLFDSEPVVVMLYKLMSEYKKYDTDMDAFFQRVKKKYRNPDRFIIIEDISELVELLTVALESRESD